ncbi:MAG TPA: hypothetical protein VFE72_08830 [Lysobacter sp.]|nr:hypothetical protein [Lysobacter sp.]
MPTYDSFGNRNNLAQETDLAPNTVREAVNVDPTNAKKLRTRPGQSAAVVPCTLGHSLFACGDFPVALFVDGDTLFAFFEDEHAEAIRGGLAPGLPVSYALINDAVFWSNGAQRGMVTVGLEPFDWACANPPGQPALEAIVGRMGPGLVQAAITFVDVRGRESGTTLAGELEQTTGGVRLTGIPAPLDPSVFAVRIYATEPGDTVLHFAGQVAPGVATFDVTSAPEGRALTTQGLVPLPAGHIVRYANGRQYVALGRRILWSPALRYGLFDPSRDWIAMPKHIDMLEPVGNGEASGLFVASGGKTYFLGGADPRAAAQRIVSPYGAVPGSTANMPARVWGFDGDEFVVAWLATSGQFVVGLPGGQLVTQNAGQAVEGVGDRAAAFFREAEGLYQFIVAQRATQLPRLALQDRVAVRTYHHDGRVT